MAQADPKGRVAFALASSTIMGHVVRCALEEGLVDFEDLYSEYEASEVDEEEYSRMLETEPDFICSEMQMRPEFRQKRKRTEEEVLGNAQNRQRQQKQIRAKKEQEMTVDAFMATCKNGAFQTVVTATLT